MPVHSLHIFDRKGKTLFTKRYMKDPDSSGPPDLEELAEQRKLVFGMLFSLREMVNSLTPSDNPQSSSSPASKDPGLHAVRTGGCTLHNFETASGLRFALFVTNASTESNYNTPGGGPGGMGQNITSPSSGGVNAPSSSTSGGAGGYGSSSTNEKQAASIRNALAHIYNDLWIQCVTRSPLYRTDEPNVLATNFEQHLDSYLATHSWFR